MADSTVSSFLSSVIIAGTSTPAETLERYFGRMDIESFFKTSKEYLSLLPLSKWTRETINGKLLNDIISTIVYLKIRKAISKTGLTMSKLFGRASSLMCTVRDH